MVIRPKIRGTNSMRLNQHQIGSPNKMAEYNVGGMLLFDKSKQNISICLITEQNIHHINLNSSKLFEANIL